MIESTGSTGVPSAGPWMALPILLLSLAGLCRFRALPPVVAWAIRITSLGVATTFASLLFLAAPRGALEIIAWFCAAISLMGSLLSAAAVRSKRGDRAGPGHVLQFFRTNALLFGAVAFTLQLIIVALRLLYLLIDLMTVVPWEALPLFEMGTGALWSIGLLFASCAVALAITREPQLYIGQLLIAIMMATGAALLMPVFRLNEQGGLEGTGSTLVMTASLAVLLFVAGATWSWADPAGAAAQSSAGLPATDDVHHGRRGLRVTCGTMVVAVILLTCYHFSVPLGVGGRVRATFLIVTGSAALAGTAGFLLAVRLQSRRLAEGAMGLLSLSICGAAVSATPYYPGPLAERYPIVFNGMVFGLATATGLCALLAARGRNAAGLRDGRLQIIVDCAWPLARRFAFLNAVLALMIAGIMAVWPRMRSIAVPDDSIGRVTMGLAGNLFLLLILLWSSRRLGSLTFHALTVLAMVSSVAFMMMRMYPYTPRFR